MVRDYMLELYRKSIVNIKESEHRDWPGIQSTQTHKHKCFKCGHIWEHGSNCINNKESHTCSECGAEVWNKYYGE